MAEYLWQAPLDHPALPGHFPGDPLIPGVVLLDWAWACCCRELPQGSRLCALPSGKFSAPVRPGMPLRIVVAQGAGRCDVQIFSDAQLCAEARFAYE